MGISIYDTPADAQFINTYERMPIEQILQAGLAMQDRWDRGEALEEDLLESLDVDALKKRTPQKQAAVKKWEDKINELVSEAGDQYHKVLPQLERLHKELRTELKEGELAGLQTEYNQRVAYEQLLDKMIDREDGSMNQTRKSELLVEADRRSGLTPALEQDEYGTWSKNQWAGLPPVEVQELGDIFSAAIKNMPMLTEETLGQWLQHANLPPGMWEKISMTIKTKGTKEALRQILYQKAMTDPKLKNFIDQSVAIEMGKLEALEAAVPGTKERMMQGADLDLVDQLQQAGIDLYSPEGQDALLKAQLERGLTESILAGPVETAIASQSGRDYYDKDGNLVKSGVIEKIYDDKHTTPTKIEGDDGDDKPETFKTYTTPGPNVVKTVSSSAGIEGKTQVEIRDNIRKKQIEIKQETDPAVRRQLEEQLQASINIVNQMEDTILANNPGLAETIAARPQPPESLDESQYLKVEQYLENELFAEIHKGGIQSVRQALVLEKGEKGQLKGSIAWGLARYSALSKALDKYEEETGTLLPRRGDENTREATQEILDEIGWVHKRSGNGRTIKSWYEPKEGVDPAAIKEIGDYLLALYDWQEDGIGQTADGKRITGFNAQEILDEKLSKGGTTEEPTVHRLGIEGTKALQASLDKMARTMKGKNAADYTVVSGGTTDVESGVDFGGGEGSFQGDYGIDETKTIITGFVAPSPALPMGAIEVTVSNKKGTKFENILISPKIGIVKKEGIDYFGLYEEIVQHLDVGASWIEAARGAVLTDNYDQKKTGRTKNSVIITPDYVNNTYTVNVGKNEEELDPVTIAEMIHYGKVDDKYSVDMQNQIQNAIGKDLTEEDMEEIESKGLLAGSKINPELSDGLRDKINTSLATTPYTFTNKGIIMKNLGLLDKIGGEGEETKSVSTSTDLTGGSATSTNSGMTSVTTSADSKAVDKVLTTPNIGKEIIDDVIGNAMGTSPDNVLLKSGKSLSSKLDENKAQEDMTSLKPTKGNIRGEGIVNIYNNVPEGTNKTLLKAITPYKDAVYGFGDKESTSSIDCSGFVAAVLKDVGAALPSEDLSSDGLWRNSTEKETYTDWEKIPNDSLKPGTVIAFDTGPRGYDSERATKIDHVGIIVFDAAGNAMIAESSGSKKGVTLTPFKERMKELKRIGLKKTFLGTYTAA